MVNADASDRLNCERPVHVDQPPGESGQRSFIIEIQVQVQAHRRQKKALRLVNWDSFRQLRAQTNAEEIDEDVPFAQWAALSSAKPEDQRMLISRDKRIAEANGALD
ncbi:hypothetical protein HPB47_004905 [Ixodes persulcatus]|uniref:Uncharacterized protein n=1 Tax=Ixodes persulcatus TaxID=34615 RepID=A0AC60PEG1_IXOPE|nr:hypothetical protein HPB47_004905 [Ixodes persulcatus]